jgi:hypothetical protein
MRQLLSLATIRIGALRPFQAGCDFRYGQPRKLGGFAHYIALLHHRLAVEETAT